MEWLSNLAKLTKPQGACCDGEVVEDLETAGFSRGSRRSRVPSLPVLCHVAVGWLSHVCVTSSPECLAVPCPERALLCLLNGGLLVSMGSHFQEDRGCVRRMCPSLELTGLGPVPSPPTYLPQDCRQGMVIPTPGFLHMRILK